jgi:hypothetical protein
MTRANANWKNGVKCMCASPDITTGIGGSHRIQLSSPAFDHVRERAIGYLHPIQMTSAQACRRTAATEDARRANGASGSAFQSDPKMIFEDVH